MATRLEVANVLGLLQASEQKKVSRETSRAYYELLKDLDGELLSAAAMHMLSTRKTYGFPKPSDIRSAVAEIRMMRAKVPSAAEAWQEVLDAPPDGIHWWRGTGTGTIHYDDDPIPDEWKHKFSHSIIDKVARNLGWPKQFWTNFLPSDRAKFIKTYNVELDRGKVEAMMLPKIADYIALRSGPTDIKEITAGFRSQTLERGE